MSSAYGDAQPEGVLAGIKVLDLSRVVSGPFASMLLSDQGASVLKVESPEGDETRAFPPFLEGESTYYLSLNRNKMGIVLNLKDHADLQVAKTLAQEADVLIHNFRPGAEERLGLSYDSLSSTNPGLIYCAISAYGRNGPGISEPGYDLFVSGLGGLMSVTGEPDSSPQRAGINFVDYMAGMNAVIGVLLALRYREEHGAGQRIDTSLLHGLLSTAQHLTTSLAATGQNPTRTKDNQHPNIVPYGTFETTDGYINVGVIAGKSWAPFCNALGLTDLIDDQRFANNVARVAQRDELLSIVADVVRMDSSSHWLKKFRSFDVPCGPINSFSDVLEDPQVAANDILSKFSHPICGELTLTKSAIQLSRSPSRIYSAPPTKGQHQQLLEAYLEGDGDQR